MRSRFIIGVSLACAATLVGRAAVAAETPRITSLSTDFVSIASETNHQTTIALYGTDLDELIFGDFEVRLGPAVATAISGNETGVNATFILESAAFRHDELYSIRVFDGDTVVEKSSTQLRVWNPWVTEYQPNGTKRFLRNTDRSRASKRTVGLNAHWALGADDAADDELFARKLDNSHTKWVREHISYAEVMGDNGDGWIERYDRTFRRYKKREMRVVAMLAYGAGSDEFAAPTAEEWRRFVRKVVRRYRNHVDAWEIWNEPDSESYLHPSTSAALKPLLKAAYPLIKHYDPTSRVLPGGIADIRDTAFIERLYKYSGDSFDELAIHLYYCDEYVHNGNHGMMLEDLNALYRAIPKKRRDEKIWITELGCSLGTAGVDETVQRRYLRTAANRLLESDRYRTILLYTIRDRPYLADAYEANFGLMSDGGQNKLAWKWYRKLPTK